MSALWIDNRYLKDSACQSAARLHSVLSNCRSQTHSRAQMIDCHFLREKQNGTPDVFSQLSYLLSYRLGLLLEDNLVIWQIGRQT